MKKNILKVLLLCAAFPVVSNDLSASGKPFQGSSMSLLLGFGQNTLGNLKGGKVADSLRHIGMKRPKGAGITALGLGIGYTSQPLSKLLFGAQLELLGGFVTAKKNFELVGGSGKIATNQRLRVNVPFSLGVQLGNALPYIEAGPLWTVQKIKGTLDNCSFGSYAKKWGVLLGGGVKMSVTSHVALSLAYRYSQANLKFKKAILESALKGKMRNQEVLLGIGYKF